MIEGILIANCIILLALEHFLVIHASVCGWEGIELLLLSLFSDTASLDDFCLLHLEWIQYNEMGCHDLGAWGVHESEGLLVHGWIDVILVWGSCSCDLALS